MESSNLSFRKWFIVIHLMTSTKKGFSAKEIQRQLGQKRYEPIWYMMQKIRMAMVPEMNGMTSLVLPKWMKASLPPLILKTGESAEESSDVVGVERTEPR